MTDLYPLTEYKIRPAKNKDIGEIIALIANTKYSQLFVWLYLSLMTLIFIVINYYMIRDFWYPMSNHLQGNRITPEILMPALIVIPVLAVLSLFPLLAFFSLSILASNNLVAVCDRRIIGYLCCMKSQDKLLITRLIVTPTHRNRGIGSSLIKSKIAKVNRPLYVPSCIASTPRAIAFFERLGFVQYSFEKRFGDFGFTPILVRLVHKSIDN